MTRGASDAARIRYIEALMPFAGWRTPLLLLGGVGLIASCAAVGLTVSSGAASSLSASHASAGWLSNDVSRAARSASVASAAPSSSPSPTDVVEPRCRTDMVLVESTCVDRFEAHLLEPQADGTLKRYPHNQRPEKRRYVAASAASVPPQAYISQVEAAEACGNAGKRLCSLREWYRACTGPTRTTYPYGKRYEKGRCNVGKKHALSLLHGTNPNGWTYDHFNDPELDLLPGFLASSGEYASCTSSEGVSDLVGNLHEWVADRVDHTLPQKLPLPAIIERRIGRNVGNGIFMGGFFSTLNQHGEGCNYTTAAHDPRYHDYSTGFRCCADAAAPSP